MEPPLNLTLREIAERVGGEVHGDENCVITGIATLQNAAPGKISFLANSRYRKHLRTTKASAVILSRSELADCPVAALVADDPYLTYARVATLFHPRLPESRAYIPPRGWRIRAPSMRLPGWDRTVSSRLASCSVPGCRSGPAASSGKA